MTRLARRPSAVDYLPASLPVDSCRCTGRLQTPIFCGQLIVRRSNSVGVLDSAASNAAIPIRILRQILLVIVCCFKRIYTKSTALRFGANHFGRFSVDFPIERQ
jgi:hypothetical protein